ncbi:unnamed protein product [Moneuplotes crassus]|uniref:Uncharacterized protein n=1 Tax=Euplotes crassus TaxID=5936 RepID=A0AAD1XUV4_EUPCR|nr:unnamed protein product [Moneuplotes crassus]
MIQLNLKQYCENIVELCLESRIPQVCVSKLSYHWTQQGKPLASLQILEMVYHILCEPMKGTKFQKLLKRFFFAVRDLTNYIFRTLKDDDYYFETIVEKEDAREIKEKLS